MKVLALRRSDACSSCGIALQPGEQAVWDASARLIRCLVCHSAGSAPVAAGAAATAVPVQTTAPTGGASAQREYDKRSTKREERIRTAHPRLGRLLLALSEEPASTRVWAQGAAGERAVAAALSDLTGDHITALHDRRMRRPDGSLSRANIDHIAVAPNGVWVIDAKTHQGALEVRRSGGFLSPRVEALYVGGRDRTALVTGSAQAGGSCEGPAAGRRCPRSGSRGAVLRGDRAPLVRQQHHSGRATCRTSGPGEAVAWSWRPEQLRPHESRGVLVAALPARMTHALGGSLRFLRHRTRVK